nr:rhodanese-like domain-containing protein [Robertkochia sp. 3YJGBD-33]
MKLIDVREPDEYEAGHIEGSRNIPLDTLQKSELDLATEATVYVICASGVRSARAVSFLQREKNMKAINVDGGMNKLKKYGMDT